MTRYITVKQYYIRIKKKHVGSKPGTLVNEEYSDRLNISWKAFNAILNIDFSHRIVAEQLKKYIFSEKNWYTSKFFSLSDMFRTAVKELKTLSPVKDMRPGGLNKNLNNVKKLEELVWFCYQIRCNSEHASKSLTSTRDGWLMKYAYEVFYELTEQYLQKKKEIK